MRHGGNVVQRCFLAGWWVMSMAIGFGYRSSMGLSDMGLGTWDYSDTHMAYKGH